MTRKRYIKLLRARLVNHSLKYGYKADYKSMQKAFSKQGRLVGCDYATAWKAIDRALSI